MGVLGAPPFDLRSGGDEAARLPIEVQTLVETAELLWTTTMPFLGLCFLLVLFSSSTYTRAGWSPAVSRTTARWRGCGTGHGYTSSLWHGMVVTVCYKGTESLTFEPSSMVKSDILRRDGSNMVVFRRFLSRMNVRPPKSRRPATTPNRMNWNEDRWVRILVVVCGSMSRRGAIDGVQGEACSAR